MPKKKTKELSDKKKAELIERGAKLDKKIKKDTAELATIKAQMQDWDANTFVTASGASVKIEKADAYEDVPPRKIYKWFKKNKFSTDDFLSCVKIMVADTRKFMGEKSFDTFRKKKKVPTTRISFLQTSVKQVEAEAGSKFSSSTRMLKI